MESQRGLVLSPPLSSPREGGTLTPLDIQVKAAMDWTSLEGEGVRDCEAFQGLIQGESWKNNQSVLRIAASARSCPCPSSDTTQGPHSNHEV